MFFLFFGRFIGGIGAENAKYRSSSDYVKIVALLDKLIFLFQLWLRFQRPSPSFSNLVHVSML